MGKGPKTLHSGDGIYIPLSPNDKMTKNASEMDFLNKILRDFVCIFSFFSILNVFEAG